MRASRVKDAQGGQGTMIDDGPVGFYVPDDNSVNAAVDRAAASGRTTIHDAVQAMPVGGKVHVDHEGTNYNFDVTQDHIDHASGK